MQYTIHVTFRCDADMERCLRVEAAKCDMNRTEFILEALREKLERVNAESTQDTTQSES